MINYTSIAIILASICFVSLVGAQKVDVGVKMDLFSVDKETDDIIQWGRDQVLKEQDYSFGVFGLFRTDSSSFLRLLIGYQKYRYDAVVVNYDAAINAYSDGNTLATRQTYLAALEYGKEFNRLAGTPFSIKCGIAVSYSLSTSSSLTSFYDWRTLADTIDYIGTIVNPTKHSINLGAFFSMHYNLGKRVYVGIKIDTYLTGTYQKGFVEQIDTYYEPSTEVVLVEDDYSYDMFYQSITSTIFRPSLTLAFAL